MSSSGWSAEELEAFRLAEAEDRANGVSHTPTAEPEVGAEAGLVSLEEFVAVDEPGAAPLLGDDESALIPEGGDVMVYGDGGAGKTTLLVDLAFHLGTGTDWLGIPVARPVRVLIVENEGPRPLQRAKLRRKLKSWRGPALDGRVVVFESPWASFTFADDIWRAELARVVGEHEIDVLIAGPLTRLGMNTAGTLQETAAFMGLVENVRQRSGRRFTSIIAHHENRAGTVSGAWEGASDTLLHVQQAGNGHTVVVIQKARWASSYHGKTLKLAWTDGEGFELEGDRDYVTDIRDLLLEHPWRTVKEIAAAVIDGGIGAGEGQVRKALDDHPDVFEMRTGAAAKAVGRAGNAKVYGLLSVLRAVGAESALKWGGGGMSASAPPLKGEQSNDAPHTGQARTAPGDESSADVDRAA